MLIKVNTKGLSIPFLYSMGNHATSWASHVSLVCRSPFFPVSEAKTFRSWLTEHFAYLF